MKSPAFQFYPTEYLGSRRVQMLTLEEEGAYIRLLCYCWQHGSIPSDPNRCAMLIGKGGSTTVARVVQAMFVECDDPTELRHDRLDKERDKQAIWREKSSQGGKKSAEKRANSKGGSTTVDGMVDECLPPKGNSLTQSLSSSPSLSQSPPSPTSANSKRERFSPPELQEWIAYGESLQPPFPKSESERVHDFYTAKGWKVGTAPMKNWQAALRTCYGRWKTEGSRTNGKQANPADRNAGTTNEAPYVYRTDRDTDPFDKFDLEAETT